MASRFVNCVDLLSLPSLLLKFSECKIVFVGDIPEMVHHVQMREEDIPCQSILWRGERCGIEPETFASCVMIFGETSVRRVQLYS